MTWIVVGVLAFASFIRSAFGFGEALVAVPLLALIMPIEVAAPVAVLVSITIAAIVVVQDWRTIHLASAARLVTATLAGTPAGLLLLTRAPAPAIKGLLALVIIGFSACMLGRPDRPAAIGERHAWFFGFVAGVLGGAYGMNGPPLVIFGTLRGWDPIRFRSTLQGYFLPASLLVMIGYWWTGLWVPAVTRAYAIALPGVLLAVIAGRYVNRRLGSGTFVRLVHGGLIVVGLVLLAQAARQ
jgi:uncharacterized membrane protein YfcA